MSSRAGDVHEYGTTHRSSSEVAKLEHGRTGIKDEPFEADMRAHVTVDAFLSQGRQQNYLLGPPSIDPSARLAGTVADLHGGSAGGADSSTALGRGPPQANYAAAQLRAQASRRASDVRHNH